jgi:hypothetical protein
LSSNKPFIERRGVNGIYRGEVATGAVMEDHDHDGEEDDIDGLDF